MLTKRSTLTMQDLVQNVLGCMCWFVYSSSFSGLLEVRTGGVHELTKSQ